ncbi:formyltransferase family protein [Candidatus Pelagibacter sp.]|nr:formyltransferase family protein [Candidatus Pelagibacter sp.]
MKIIILTGSETRHEFFRKKIASDARFSVLSTYCESAEQSLENRIKLNKESSELELQHVKARSQAEKDFFEVSLNSINDLSNANYIAKGEINDEKLVQDIINKQPDLLVCYGSSLIRSKLLTVFEGRFLNVHLGLSPYYRGSGANIWPLINDEPDMVGATFMHINQGIDTGEIIHQIRSDIFLGDSPHSIGNRVIMKMTNTYADIIANFDNLTSEKQPVANGKLYTQKDFDNIACHKLYQKFYNGLIEKFLISRDQKKNSYIVENRGINK